MKRIVKNIARAVFVVFGTICSARIFFTLGYISSARGIAGLLLSFAYTAGLFIGVKCMFGLYDEIVAWLAGRGKKT